MNKMALPFSMFVAVTVLTACATTDTKKTLAASSPVNVSSPTATDVMQTGGTYEFVKPEAPIYANSSAELAERYVGRHVDELPEATSSRKAVQDKNEVVCKVIGRTHTRLRKKKVCAPRKEWDLHEAKAEELMRTKQITRRGCGVDQPC